MRATLLRLASLCLAVGTFASCGTSATPTTQDDDGSSGDVQADTIQTDVDSSAAGDAAADIGAPEAPACDPIHPTWCGLPWPSNLYLVADASRKTGFRLQFGQNSLPQNSGGNRVDPAAYTHLDGYGVGSSLLMHWPNLDVTGLPSEATIAHSLTTDAKIVLLEVVAGKVTRHVPYFVELDGTEVDPAKKTLIVRPAEILHEATRYVVGVRGLVDTKGVKFAPSEAFSALVAGTATGHTGTRQAQFDGIFALLAGEGLPKADLQLAWDFVTASSEAEHGRLLQMRDDAQKVVGASGPELTVKQVTEWTPSENADIAFEVTGTFHVPNYTKVDGEGAVGLNLDGAGKPVQNGWRDVEFRARVPRGALTGVPHGTLMYGHGLNGGPDEIGGGYLGIIAQTQKRVVYGCPMWGMSESDVGDILKSLYDMRLFPTMTSKLQQAMVEHVLLQRAMRERFGSLDAVSKRGVVIDKARTHYYGNSQGGIYGGTVMALSTDVVRGGLGVLGSNYSILLQRSVDFTEFFQILQGVYGDTRDMAILLNTIQLLWDSVDPVSHYRHLKLDPYPGTPTHEVLCDIAIGDYQVAPVSMEIAMRSDSGLKLMANWGRDVFGLAPQSYPYTGSGIVSWGYGNPWATPGNLPPPNEKKDPHGKVRKQAEHQAQLDHFLETGEIVDVCGGKPCYFGP